MSAVNSGLGLRLPDTGQQDERELVQSPKQLREIEFALRLLRTPDGHHGNEPYEYPFTNGATSPPSSSLPRRPRLGHTDSNQSRSRGLSSQSVETVTSATSPPSKPTSPGYLQQSASRKHAGSAKNNGRVELNEEKEALKKLVAMYEHLSSQLKATQSREDELETNLKIARSNLALAENHAEQLEDTIKRNSQIMARMSSSSTAASGASPVPSGQHSLHRTASRSPNLATIATSQLHQQAHEHESEPASAHSPRIGAFWRRKATLGTASSPNLAQLAADGKPRDSYDGSSEGEEVHNLRRKPSGNMLRSSSANIPLSEKEKHQALQITSLQNTLLSLQESYKSLEAENASLRASNEGLTAKYSALQEEIENLSVSLFEEANTMVAEERKVNTFLNNQLDKAKEEVENLSKEIDGLRQSLALAKSQQRQKRSSTEQANLSAYRMPRKASVSSVASSSELHPSLSAPASATKTHNFKRSRRRSSVVAIDILDSLSAVQSSSSARRASREVANAAAAIRALAQREEDDNYPGVASTPQSATASRRMSISSLNKSSDVTTSNEKAASSGDPLQPSQPSHPLSRSESLNLAATYPGKEIDGTDHQQVQERMAESAEADDAAEALEMASRPRWFSFGSKKRPPKPEILLPATTTRVGATNGSPLSPIPPSPVSPYSASPADEGSRHGKTLSFSSALDTIRGNSRAKLSASPEGEGMPDALAASTLMQASKSHPLPKRSETLPPLSSALPVPFAANRTVSSTSTASASSANTLVPEPAARSQRDRFFSATSVSISPTLPQHSPKPSVDSFSDSIDTEASLDAEHSISRAYSTSELDNLLDDVAADSVTRMHFPSHRANDHDYVASSNADEDDARAHADVSSPSSDGRDSKSNANSLRNRNAMWSDTKGRTTTNGSTSTSRPASAASVRSDGAGDAQVQPLRFSSPSGPSYDAGGDVMDTVRKPLISPLSLTESPSWLSPSKTAAKVSESPSQANLTKSDIQVSGANKRRHALQPLNLSSASSTLRGHQQSGALSPVDASGRISPFAMPTPPAFKRFPSSGSYKAPLRSPSHAIADLDSAALPFSSSSGTSINHSSTAGANGSLPGSGSASRGLPQPADLYRSGSFRSDASFASLNAYLDGARGLQRQNSTGISGSGSLVEDLDSLLKSIDAIHESLGLEEEEEGEQPKTS